MIPRANVKNLMLKHEVVDAVRDGQFHVWQVGNVTDGIELLTGLPAGQADVDGNYPVDSVFGRVQHTLHTFLERTRKLRRRSEHGCGVVIVATGPGQDPGCAGDE